jgi:Leucine-rich repeat (LRR) protein
VQLHSNLFKNLANLAELDLSGNFIKELGQNETHLFDDLVSLQYLYLNYNSLASFGTGTFKNLGNLSHLYLGNNLVRKIDETTFVGLKKLEYLDLQENKLLSSVHPKAFKGLVPLKQLKLHTNWIQDFDENLFSNLINLEILDLRKTEIDYLPEKLFQNLSSLRQLYLQFNRIKSLNGNLFKNLINLEEVGFYAALFKTVPDNIFKHNGNLTSIILRASITRMSNKVFSHLKKLRNINLADNDCISVEISNHNSSIFLTEDILTPCSCQVFVNEKNQFFIEVLLVLIGVVVAIISSIFVIMLIKFWQQKNFQAVGLCMGLKNGKS